MDTLIKPAKKQIEIDPLLSQHLSWLQNIVNQRLMHYEESFAQILEKCPVPSVMGKSFTASFLQEKIALPEEKLIFFLSLLPYYFPDYLGSFLKNGKDEILLCSRSSINGLAIPTVETALIILSGANLQERHKYLCYFMGNPRIIKDQTISIAQASPHDPFTSLRLLPGEDNFNSFLSGESLPTSFSQNFPASLLETDYNWSDLILPYDTKQQVEELREWIEFDKIAKTGALGQNKFQPGCKCLFHGPPGTGKTLTASLLGKITNKKVYRIDLSAVVSKYIGETEKKLSLVFDKASHGNWILFFDEADALFGKRSKTNNAHDRYANQEVSYLLQRFEAYQGTTILASNFIDNIDPAFYRRFNNIVFFKKPEYEERLKLWEKYLPQDFMFDSSVSIEEIANTIDVNGSAIYNIMRRSYMKAVLRGESTIKGKDMFESLKLEKTKEGKIFI